MTKDVPPFAIVAGNPARIIGYRFNPEQIDALQKIAWCDWSAEKIYSKQESLNSDIDQFIKDHIDSASAYWSSIPEAAIPRVNSNLPSIKNHN